MFFEIAVSGIMFFISLLGVIEIYVVENINDSWLVVCRNFVVKLPSGFSVEIMWWLLAMIVLITAVEWLCNEIQFERVFVENLK